jgi:hypothetical protein
MRTVWKTPIPLRDEFTLDLPDALPLHFAVQRGRMTLWSEVDPSAPLSTVHFRLAGTGHPLEDPPDRRRYIGTVLLEGGELVFHLFQVIS